MIQKYLALGALLLATTVSHADTTRGWHFTGDELVAALLGKLPSGMNDVELRRQFSVSYAQAYIQGVADTTSGTRWCAGIGILPHELNEQVYNYLAALPPSERNSSAAPLVADALEQLFPCAPTLTSR